MADTRRPYVVGLTGGIGSGKSTVAEHFHTCGAKIIDADATSHDVTAPGEAGALAIAAAFGDSVMRADGAVDRAALRERVFADVEMKAKLEALLHPLIRAEMNAALAAAVDAPYVIWMVPLLLESKTARTVVDRIAVVDCAPQQQVARVMRRSGLSETAIRAIMAAQVDRETRLAAADDIIDNSGESPAIAPQVVVLDRQYRALALRNLQKPS